MKKLRKGGNAAETILLAAADAIGMICRGACTLDDYLDFHAPPDHRRTVEHLLLAFFRHRRFFQDELKKIASREPDPQIKNLILSAFTQIRFQNRIAMQSAVSVAVDAAKKYRADKFVNAVLRKFAAAGTPLPDDPEHILPEAVYARWKKRFTAEQLQELSRLFTSEADFTFRLAKGAEQPGFKCEYLGKTGLFDFYRSDAADAVNSAELKAGKIYIQDPAAAHAPSVPDYSAVKTVLDLCAAPGGKSLMMSENLTDDAVLTAFDRSQARQKLTKQNFDKKNLRHKVVWGDLADLTGSFDLVLADVPCSNTGVYKRRPDALWRFSSTELRKITVLQKEILSHAARLTAAGGQLVYSTCSIEPEENGSLIDGFLTEHPEFVQLCRQTVLPDDKSDGCSFALLKKAKK